MSMKKHESTNIIVEWTSDHSSISHFNVYITKGDNQKFLGHTTGCKYVINNSIVQHEETIKVTVQPVLKIGLVIPINQCKSVTLSN